MEEQSACKPPYTGVGGGGPRPTLGGREQQLQDGAAGRMLEVSQAEPMSPSAAEMSSEHAG